MGKAPASGGIQSNPAGKIPATNSQQRLMPTDSDSVTSSMDEGELRVARGNPHDEDTDTVTTTTTSSIGANAWFTVGVLCFVNLINYMDRFTIAVVVTHLRKKITRTRRVRIVAGNLATTYTITNAWANAFGSDLVRNNG
uniref:Major facilitator superfamily (MFS) profile domain-containing protein n=1 Tax=Anopheles coluzzii TaxID=1518534 RepID=A0A8W7PZ98_ANOCL